MKQTLQDSIAEGKTAQVLAQLKQLTTSDKALHAQVIATTARFAEYETQKHANTVDYDPLSIERNKINAAVLFIIEKLPDDVAGLSFPNVGNAPALSKRSKWLKIGAAIVAAIGVMASIAQISGYALKDFFLKKEKIESVVPQPQPAVESKKTDKPIVEMPQKAVEKATTPSSSVKNQSNIKVEKGGKVGTIITGDSNKIDIKQEF